MDPNTGEHQQSQGPPAAEPPAKKNRVATTIGYLIGILLLGAWLILPAFWADGDNVAYEIGRNAAPVLIALAISFGVWYLIHRSNRDRFPASSPWILVIAFLLTGPLRAPAVLDDENTVDSTVRKAAVENVEASDYLAKIPGFEYRRLTAAQEDKAMDAFRESGGEPDELFLDYEIRQIVRGRRVMGAVQIAVPRGAEEDFEATKQGMLEGMSDSAGQEPRAVEVDDGTLHLVELRQGVMATVFQDPVAVMIFAADVPSAKLFAVPYL